MHANAYFTNFPQISFGIRTALSSHWKCSDKMDSVKELKQTTWVGADATWHMPSSASPVVTGDFQHIKFLSPCCTTHKHSLCQYLCFIAFTDANKNGYVHRHKQPETNTLGGDLEPAGVVSVRKKPPESRWHCWDGLCSSPSSSGWTELNCL